MKAFGGAKIEVRTLYNTTFRKTKNQTLSLYMLGAIISATTI